MDESQVFPFRRPAPAGLPALLRPTGNIPPMLELLQAQGQ